MTIPGTEISGAASLGPRGLVMECGRRYIGAPASTWRVVTICLKSKPEQSSPVRICTVPRPITLKLRPSHLSEFRATIGFERKANVRNSNK